MAGLFSQYASGAQLPAGPTVGSTLGVSGVNAIVDRLNSISDTDGLYSNMQGGSGINFVGGSIIDLTNKTSFLSINGTEFLPPTQSSDFTRDITGVITTDVGVLQLRASVHLPHNSVVTECIVYSNDATEVWTLSRHPINSDGTANTMATANMNTADSSISDATIDNSTRRYTLGAANQDSGDTVRGALITYTTNYD